MLFFALIIKFKRKNHNQSTINDKYLFKNELFLNIDLVLEL